MTVYLEAPTYTPSGPDGKGWNRLSLNAHMGSPRARCALQPTTYATLWESRDTRRARWSDAYRPCQRGGRCGDCPILTAPPFTLASFTDRVLVRLDDRGRLWLMNKPEDGWSSRATPVTWTELAHITGWDIGRQHHDEHGTGFWLVREEVSPVDTTEGREQQ